MRITRIFTKGKEHPHATRQADSGRADERLPRRQLNNPHGETTRDNRRPRIRRHATKNKRPPRTVDVSRSSQNSEWVAGSRNVKMNRDGDNSDGISRPNQSASSSSSSVLQDHPRTCGSSPSPSVLARQRGVLRSRHPEIIVILSEAFPKVFSCVSTKSLFPLYRRPPIINTKLAQVLVISQFNRQSDLMSLV